MLHRVYAIRDAKAEAWLPPFMSTNDAVCARTISNLVADGSHPFGQNPGDYALFYLGQWDDNSCKYELESAPVHVCNLVELISGVDSSKA